MKLKAAVFVNQIRAAFKALSISVGSSAGQSASASEFRRIAASVSEINRILMDAEAGTFVYFAKYFDTFYLKDGAGSSDGAILSFFKTLTDDVGFAENATNQFMKALAHTAGASDTIDFFAFGKELKHTSVIQEDYTAWLQKPVSDEFSVTDDGARLHPNKITGDGVESSDEITTKEFGLHKVDPATASEEHYYDLTKPIPDGFGLTDDDVLAVGKFLTDSVNGVEDHVFIFTKKAKEDEFSALDFYEAYVSKPFTDPTLLSDNDTIQYGKVTFETSTVSDAIDRFDTTKELTDRVSFTDDVDGAASILDDQEMQFMKYTTHIASASEDFYRQVVFVRYFTEQASTEDAHYLNFFKTLEEQVTGVEDHVFIFAKKVKEDSFSVEEAFSAAVWKPFSDPYTVSDAYTLEPGKVLFDGNVVTDVTALSSIKVTSETLNIGEQLNTLAVGLNKADSVGLSETRFSALWKPVSDTFTVSEAAALASSKPQTDEVLIAEYAFVVFGRPAADALGLSDTDTIAVGKIFQDAPSVAEAINTITYGKKPGDTGVVSDGVDFLATEKNLADTVSFTDDVDGAASILDDQEMQFMKQRTDTIGVTDVFIIYKTFRRAFAETASVSDAVDARSVGKYIFDAFDAFDSTNLLTGKHIYDIPVASETLAYALARVRSDSALLGDANNVTFNKTLLELTSTADAGSLRSQGFSDFSYFAEDFVGASRTF